MDLTKNRCKLDSTGLGQGPMVGFCKHKVSYKDTLKWKKETDIHSYVLLHELHYNNAPHVATWSLGANSNNILSSNSQQCDYGNCIATSHQ